MVRVQLNDPLDGSEATGPVARIRNQEAHEADTEGVSRIERPDPVGGLAKRPQLAPEVVSRCKGPMGRGTCRIQLDRPTCRS